jgi:hypothetical protein
MHGDTSIIQSDAVAVDEKAGLAGRARLLPATATLFAAAAVLLACGLAVAMSLS